MHPLRHQDVKLGLRHVSMLTVTGAVKRSRSSTWRACTTCTRLWPAKAWQIVFHGMLRVIPHRQWLGGG